MEYFKAQALAVALHPRNPAPTSNERCGDCAHWQPNGAEASHAPCEVIPGECAHDFWCDYWKQLAPDVTAEKLAAAISAGSESNKEPLS